MPGPVAGTPRESFEIFVHRVRTGVEKKLLSLTEPPYGAQPPPRLLEAVRFALLGGGKRLRPILVIASGEATRTDETRQDRPDGIASRLSTAACAIEMIHTFSLIHDDLPALDDDALRRGRPTLHVKYDEATAILAGDALLNLAFEVMSRGEGPPAVWLAAIGAVSRAVGMEGMISGQVLDLEGEKTPVDAGRLHRTHMLKTGALITACCEVGGILADAGEKTRTRLREYGKHLGLAFQIVDDILDVEGSAEMLGKSPGKDAKASKATFPAMWGVSESRRRAAESVELSCAAVTGCEQEIRPGQLIALAQEVLTRSR